MKLQDMKSRTFLKGVIFFSTWELRTNYNNFNKNIISYNVIDKESETKKGTNIANKISLEKKEYPNTQISKVFCLKLNISTKTKQIEFTI